MIKTPKRMLSLLLAGAMLGSVFTPTRAFAAQDSRSATTGQISATLRLDYPQEIGQLESRKVQVELKKGSQSLGKLSLAKSQESAKLSQYPASVTVKNSEGGTPEGQWPGSVDVSISNLPTGDYQLKFTGEGYCDRTVDLTLRDYSKHVTIGTGDATFALGDFNGDNVVNDKDRSLLIEKLGSKESRDLAQFDLNGDGEISVVDLSYVTRNVGATGDVILTKTALLNAVDVGETETELEKTTKVTGDLNNLFQPNGQTVKLEPTEENQNEIQIPVVLTRMSHLEAVQINTPSGSGEVENGYVTVTYEDNETEKIPFGSVLPKDIHALSNHVITVNLGRRVAVKEITITVVKDSNDKYVTIESIQFLEDIVPENPVAPNSEVKNVAATAGSEKVSLTWSELPNVAGYRVDYWPKEDSNSKNSLTVNVNKAEVSGLDNNEVYCFTVTPVDGSWQGVTSPVVEAEPVPSSAPKAPDMVNLGEQDGALSVSWKKAENATYYKVFYQVKNSGEQWTQAGEQLATTSTTISGLTNGTTYSVYVISGNSIGESGRSRISEATPKATDFSRPNGIPTEGMVARDEIKSIRLADANNVSDSSFNPEFLIDGDFKTSWTARTWSWNEHIITTFQEPIDLNSAIWTPRMDGNYPQWLRVYSVTVWYANDDLNKPGHLLVPDPEGGGRDDGATGNSSCMSTWPAVRNEPAKTRFAVLPFGPVKGVKQISVAVEQVGYNLTSCSELMFQKYDPTKCLPEEIAALFTDELHTQLKSGTTQGQIDALRERLNGDEKNYYLYVDALADELKLAEELLKKEKGSSVVIEGIESRNPVKDNEYGQGGSLLQPLGVAAEAGSEITIYATGIPEGQKVEVTATQFNAEANAWSAKAGALINGRNVLTIPKIGSQNTPRGGSLYITYSGAGAENIKLHVRRATDIPMLNLTNWYTMDDAARNSAIKAYTEELADYVKVGIQDNDWKNVTEISTPTVLLSLAANAANSGLGNGDKVKQLTNSVLAWEDLMHICKTTQGIDNTYDKNDMRTRQNIRCMQMFSGAFMYAAGSHIGIGYGSCPGMVGGTPIAQLDQNATANNLFGWGIAHEIGHNMDKLGKAETTNNIYSIMAQTYDGKQNTLASRLEKSNKYPKVFQKVAEGIPGASNDVFVQLGMYWQLHLAYDDGAAPMDFYNKFFKAWKKGTYFNGASSYDDKFALTASAVAGKDLTEFFTRWGMTLSEGTKKKLETYAKEDRAIWYLSDQSRRDRLAGKTASTGEVSVTAAKKDDKTITLTLSTENLNGGGVLQGYEILRKDSGTAGEFKSIAFTSEGTYDDVIGSANHRTFTYKVVAYDTLGNVVGAAESQEMRIAYDKTVGADQYDITRNEDNSVTIALKKETAVSGLKISGDNRPKEGDFTVAITCSVENAEDKTTIARSGNFKENNQAVDDNNSYLTYFQKPGAGAEDTRIWTYDAKTVTITGIPADMNLANVQLVSYAGDDVSFLDGGFTGVLSEDYKYGDGADQTIPKGTLVILGNYRGNPVFQKIRIEGEFTKTEVTDQGEGSTTVETRPMDGKLLMFAEIPEDGEVSDISDGIFIFIPNVQREAELQGESSNCSGVNLLPSRIRAVLYRTDMPETAGDARVSAETLWTNAPGGTDLPTVVLKAE